MPDPTDKIRRVAIAVAAEFLIGGGTWFIACPEVGKVRIPRSRRRMGMSMNCITRGRVGDWQSRKRQGVRFGG